MRISVNKTVKFKKAIAWISILVVVFAINFSVAEKVFAQAAESLPTASGIQAIQQEQAINADQGASGATQAQAEASAGVKQSSDQPGTYVGTGGGIGKSNEAVPGASAGSSKPTNADTAKELSGIAYIVVYIGTRIMVWASYLVDFALKFSSDIMGLEAVQTGWKIVLNATNLGFVLAIVVIAFATIFRRESYGMKKTLWKLVVAALLVNFSLVICGGFLSAGNTVTDVFLKASLGTDGSNLSNALGNAFNPQKLGAVSNVSDPGFVSSVAGLVTGDFKPMLEYLASIIFVVIFTFLMVLAFITLFLMLLMRGLWLIFLLILSPIVWLLWIFPSTSSYFKKWWDNFLRWTFFAPAVLFFIYLTIATATNLNGSSTLSSIEQAKSTYASAGVSVDASTFGIGDAGGFARYSANLFIILGMLFGGIYAANTLGMKGGNFGVNWASKVGKGVGAWAGRKGARLGTYPMRLKPVSSAMESLQRVGSQFGPSRAGKFGRWLTTPIRKAGDYGKDLGQAPSSYISETESQLNKLPNADERALRWHSLDTPGKIALLQSLRKSKDIDLLMTKANVDPKEINQVLKQMAKYKQRAKDVTEVVPIFATQNGVNIYDKIQEGKFDEAEVATTSFLKELSPSKFSSAQFADMTRGLFRGKIDQATWDTKGVRMLARSVIKGAPPEGMSNLYRGFKKQERDLIHKEISSNLPIDTGDPAIIGLPTVHERKIATLRKEKLSNGSVNEFYNPALAKFYESSFAAADMGLDLN